MTRQRVMCGGAENLEKYDSIAFVVKWQLCAAALKFGLSVFFSSILFVLFIYLLRSQSIAPCFFFIYFFLNLAVFGFHVFKSHYLELQWVSLTSLLLKYNGSAQRISSTSTSSEMAYWCPAACQCEVSAWLTVTGESLSSCPKHLNFLSINDQLMSHLAELQNKTGLAQIEPWWW